MSKLKRGVALIAELFTAKSLKIPKG